MHNLLVDVDALMEICSHCQVVVADAAVADAARAHCDEPDNVVEKYYSLVLHFVPSSTAMPPDDDAHADHDCSMNDLDYPRKTTVMRHEHPRWNRNQVLVWPVVEIHHSHMPWRVVIPAIIVNKRSVILETTFIEPQAKKSAQLKNCEIRN